MPSERRRDRPTLRRAADRHYLAVVAAEARRLGRELRPAASSRRPAGPTIGKGSRPAGAH
jgi:hypothetical protein